MVQRLAVPQGKPNAEQLRFVRRDDSSAVPRFRPRTSHFPGVSWCKRLPLPRARGSRMKKLVLSLLISCASCAPNLAANTELAEWQQQAQNVTIIRDDWGIAHVYGKTDADAVFGAIYAQGEDDFNRIETNYLNSMGRDRKSTRLNS